VAIRKILFATVGCAAFLLALPGPVTGQPSSAATRRSLLQEQGVNAEITVFPIRLGALAMPEVGEIFAIFLEQGGMPNLDWTTQVFPRAGEPQFPQMVTEFGDFVRRAATPVPYSLYAEVLGGPSGITEIRGVLVDKAGEPVWTYRQTPQDEEFRKSDPKEPLACLMMLMGSLRATLGLRNASGSEAFEGRLAKRNAERIGLPTNGEQAAMRKAFEDARPMLSAAKVAVFEVLVGGQPDRRQAAHLIELLNAGKLGAAAPATSQPAVQIPTGPNEQERLWRVARAVSAHLRQSPASADYALFADYALDPNGRPFTVHFILCDAKGEWVMVDFQNNHHPDFNSMELKTGDDCDRLVVKRLADALRNAPGNRN
jgi:hypothetical protein